MQPRTKTDNSRRQDKQRSPGPSGLRLWARKQADMTRICSTLTSRQLPEHYSKMAQLLHTPLLTKFNKINIQQWMLAIRCEAPGVKISNALMNARFIPNLDQLKPLSVLKSVIISFLPDNLVTSIISPDMAINPQLLITN